VSTNAPVVETVSRKRVIPPAELAREQSTRTTPEFWEFIESMTDEMWAGDYMLYILREDPKASNYGGSNTLEKCPGFMMMPNGVRVKLDSREDVELAIKEKWGGKAFRLILKKGRERMCEGKCSNDAPPKFPDNATQQFSHPLPNAGQQSDANAIASKAIDTVANQPAEMMTIGITALRTAAELMAKNASAPSVPPQSNDSDLDRAFKQAMIAKLLAPPPDPFEMFVRFKQLMGDGSNGMGGPVVERLLNGAIDKILNPAPAITGRTTLLDLGREFVPVIGQVMHEYRLSREADAHIAELMRNAAQPQAQPNPPALPVTNQAFAPAPAPQPQAAAQPAVPPITFHQIEERIAKIVTNLEFSTDEAVDKVLEFLYDTDARLPGLLLNPPALDPRLKAGKEGLLMLFQFEPILQPCVTNLPRLSEFIDKFIVAATEAEANEARLRAAAPNAAAPNPPPA
jgi:hypothetical protein